MKNRMVRLLSLLLVLILALQPVTAFAADSLSISDSKMMSGSIAPKAGEPDSEELLWGYLYQQAGLDITQCNTGLGSIRPSYGAAANNLTGVEKEIFNALKPKMQSLARSGGSTDITVSYSSASPSDWSAATRKIVMALMNELPYDMYWFDKTIGWGYAYNSSQFRIRFSVVQKYRQGGDQYTVNANVSGVTTAANNAKAIVSANAGKTDKAKLDAYKNKLIALNTYNHDAAEDWYFDTYGYGDPWQVIWMFDGDSSTNVVCEGYAKAFKYLCDLTSWYNSVECLISSGDVYSSYGGGGAHMWNILRYNKVGYHVDVTWCDGDGYTGWPFFMNGVTTYSTSHFRAYNGSAYADYYLDSETLNGYSAANLALSSSAFNETAVGKPTITKQPASQTVYAGNKASFSVTASNATGYQWQYSKDGGSTWTNCASTGYNTATFSFSASTAHNGWKYRCKVSNSNGTAISSVATLTVKVSLPTITSNPTSKTVTAGNKASFSVIASNATAYQWQYSDDGSTWTNCASTGYNTATFSFTATMAYNNRQYRCRVSNAGGSVYSTAAKLTVKVAPPTITSNPVSKTVTAGNKVSFTVAAKNATAYRWQYSDDGTTWTNCASTGYNTANFSFTATMAYNNRQYRCRVSNAGGSVYSSAAKLTVKVAPPTITSNPVSKTVTVGDKVSFSVTASNATAYQWQYSDNGTTWTNCGSTGYNTANFSFTATAAYNNRQYRCRVSNAGGSVYSSAAKLTVKVVLPTITSNPVSKTVTVGDKVSFSVTASNATAYQWQYSDNGTTWTNCGSTGYNTATFSFTATAAYNNRMYRCRVSNSSGVVFSSTATLTVRSYGPTITSQPKNLTVAAGAKASFSVVATGATAYQWQYSDNGTTWTNCGSTGYNTANFSFTAVAAFNNRMYRCRVSNSSGTTYSAAAVLTVK